MNYKEQFENLTFKDDFMFGVVMSDLSIAKRVLAVILADEIPDIENCELQKNIDNDYESHAVRYDVYIKTKDGNKAYIIEMQNANNLRLPKRCRYYQASSDMDFLSKGKLYTELPQNYVIFVCDFDHFGKDKAIYRFENYCKEDNISLGDDTYKVFLNINGKTERKELQNFMSYIQDNTPNDDLTQDIQSRISNAKHDEKLYSSYVKEQQNGLLLRQDGKLSVIKGLLDIGRSIKEIADFFKTDEESILNILAQG